jgi:hypothetical protein
MDAIVTRLVQTPHGQWEMELRAVGGTVAQIAAAGRPLVRVGEKVAQDQLVFVVDRPGDADSTANVVRIDLRRNGVAMDLSTAPARR